MDRKSTVPDWVIRISDGFCNWEYSFDSGRELSINDVIQKIMRGTGLIVISKRRIKKVPNPAY